MVAVLATGAAAAENPYVQANARLLSLVKPYPGARLIRVDSDPYSAPDSDHGPIIGYTTVAYYALPKPVANHAIASFYTRELRGWHETITTIPCRVVAPPPGAPATTNPGTCTGVTSVSFTKGNALIQIQGLYSDAHYNLTIDSEYSKNPH